MNRSVRVFIGLEIAPAIGGWADVDPDSDMTDAAIGAVLIGLNPKFAEYGVMDTDDFPGRSTSLRLIQMCVTVADMSGVDLDAVVAYVENHDSSGDLWGDEHDLQAAFDEAYDGFHDSELDWAYYYVDQTGALDAVSDSLLARYFDYAAFARDAFMGDMWSAPCPTGGVYVFNAL
jgi:antirestriction protein